MRRPFSPGAGPVYATGVPEHVGARRRASPLPVGWLVGVGIAVLVVIAIVLVVVLIQPGSGPTASARATGSPAPTWTGPAPHSFSGQLSDGTAYEPRLFLNANDSVGVALTADGSAWRVLTRVNGTLSELRRVPASDAPQFDGFAASGDTVVWAESAAKAGADVRTTVYRSNWRTGAKASVVTAGIADASFFGGSYDLVVRDGRVFWAVAGSGPVTEIRSVALNGGTVASTKLSGPFGLTTPPWAVTTGAGPGKPVDLVNLTTNQKLTVNTAPSETASCGPTWCRIAVLGGGALVHVDLEHPDGSGRRRIAGSESTPAIDQVALLDRFVALKTDVTGAEDGLSLYDIDSGKTSLVAIGVANVRAAAAALWWSTGSGGSTVWSALDLSAVA
jgi:hypothetical protein